MSINNRRELSLLNHEEGELIRASHHPAIAQLDTKDLAETRQRLRALRDKERTLARQKVREARGKGERRGSGTAEHLQERKQVFASALRRVNKQAHRMHVEEARAAQREALALEAWFDATAPALNEAIACPMKRLICVTPPVTAAGSASTSRRFTFGVSRGR